MRSSGGLRSASSHGSISANSTQCGLLALLFSARHVSWWVAPISPHLWEVRNAEFVTVDGGERVRIADFSMYATRTQRSKPINRMLWEVRNAEFVQVVGGT